MRKTEILNSSEEDIPFKQCSPYSIKISALLAILMVVFDVDD